MEKGAPSASSRKPAMMMLGGVPISVISPPRMEAKDSGIRLRPGWRRACDAAFMSIGIKSASAATLFISADSTAATPDITPICANSERPRATTCRASNSTAPELDRPRLTTSTSAMITVAGCAKPSKARSSGTAPMRIAATSAPNATRSWRIFPHNSSANTAPSRENKTICSLVIIK